MASAARGKGQRSIALARRPASTSAADRSADFAERLVGIRAQRRDRHQADHDDQREHHGVFDRRRAIFPTKQFRDEALDTTHTISVSSESWVALATSAVTKTLAHVKRRE